MTARPDDPDFRELCPCCGGDGIYVDSCSDCAGQWSVGCTTCGLHNNADTRADALAAWNRRAALEPQDALAVAGELVALRAEVERLRACAPEQLTRAQIDSACLSYRHDYGLCTESEARHQRHECAEWFRAIRAALTPPASQEGQADG